jgi:phosphatidate phosphatase APP1
VWFLHAVVVAVVTALGAFSRVSQRMEEATFFFPSQKAADFFAPLNGDKRRNFTVD